MIAFLVIVALAVIAFAIWVAVEWKAGAEQERRDTYNGVSPQQRMQLNKEAEERRWAEKHPGDAKIVCPHCQVLGQVRVTEVQRKQGVSGGKATAGLLTGGASLVLVGLSKKGWMHHLHCRNCNMQWDVA